ncbi:MAG: hypothetical protein ACFB51_13475, partial [Anaerolineae bacterium]
DPDMLTAARLQLETIAQNDTDERVRRMALHFFQMDDLKAMESTGKLSRREVLAAAESAREEMTEMQEEMQRDTGTDLQAVKDELLDSVTTQDRISSSDVIEALYAEDPNARISRSPDHPDAKPPARDLRQWSSVRSQIDDMLGELEDAYDEEAREAKYEDHNAPTLMRGINLEDLERSLRDDRDDEE